MLNLALIYAISEWVVLDGAILFCGQPIARLCLVMGFEQVCDLLLDAEKPSYKLGQ